MADTPTGGGTPPTFDLNQFQSALDDLYRQAWAQSENPLAALRTLLFPPDKKETLSPEQINSWNQIENGTANQLLGDGICGMHIVMGFPRSGKTTFVNDLRKQYIEKGYKVKLLNLDEPKMMAGQSMAYGAQGLAKGIYEFLNSDDSHVLIIDSFRLLVYSLKGTAMAGGLISSMKSLITILQNIAIGYGRIIIGVLTTDTDLINDVRAAVSELSVVDRFQVVSQYRSDDTVDLNVGGKSFISTEIGTVEFDKMIVKTKLKYKKIPGIRLDSYELVLKAMRDDPEAIQALKDGVSAKQFSEMKRYGRWAPIPVDELWDTTQAYGDMNVSGATGGEAGGGSFTLFEGEDEEVD